MDAIPRAAELMRALVDDHDNLKFLRAGIKQKMGIIQIYVAPQWHLPENARPKYWSDNGACNADTCPRVVFTENVEAIGELLAQMIERKIESQEQQLCTLGIRP